MASIWGKERVLIGFPFLATKDVLLSFRIKTPSSEKIESHSFFCKATMKYLVYRGEITLIGLCRSKDYYAMYKYMVFQGRCPHKLYCEDDGDACDVCRAFFEVIQKVDDLVIIAQSNIREQWNIRVGILAIGSRHWLSWAPSITNDATKVERLFFLDKYRDVVGHFSYHNHCHGDCHDLLWAQPLGLR